MWKTVYCLHDVCCFLMSVWCRSFHCVYVATSFYRAAWKSVRIFIPYETSFSLVFLENERLVGATPSTWNFGSTGPRWRKITDFEPIIARRASAVTPSKKVQLTPIGSRLCALQWAHDERRTLSLSLPKGGSKCNVSDIWTISCDNS